MNKESLTAELLALAQAQPDDPTRSKAARLRAVLPAVEAALSAGTSREKVLEKLKEHGLDMSLAVFNTTLRRVRAARNKKSEPAPAPAVPVAQVAPKPDGKPPVRSALGSPLIPELGNAGEPDDMDDLIKHAKRNKS